MLDFATPTETTKFTDQQAREHLAAITGKRPPVRELAAAFGWSKSTVARFLSQVDGRTAGHDEQPSASERRLMAVEGLKDVEQQFRNATADEMVDSAIAKGIVDLTATDESASAEEPNPFSPESEDFLQGGTDDVAVYVNTAGNVVIRAETDRDGDVVILIAPSTLPKLIERLQQFQRAPV